MDPRCLYSSNAALLVSKSRKIEMAKRPPGQQLDKLITKSLKEALVISLITRVNISRQNMVHLDSISSKVALPGRFWELARRLRSCGAICADFITNVTEPRRQGTPATTTPNNPGMLNYKQPTTNYVHKLC